MVANPRASRAACSSANYSINRDHLLWQPVQQVLDSRARLLRGIREHFAQYTDVDAAQITLSVCLYGSAARGDSHAASDIDLAVIHENEEQKIKDAPTVEALVLAIETWNANPEIGRAHV